MKSEKIIEKLNGYKEYFRGIRIQNLNEDELADTLEEVVLLLEEK